MATSVTYGINLLLLALCAWFSEARMRSEGDPWSTQAFADVAHFIRLGLPSTIFACMESWGIHALLPMAGLLHPSDVHLGVMTVLLTTFFFAFTIAFGFGAALR